MTLRTLALLVSASLCLSQVIWHVQANAPRDWPEHTLALACRMTFNDEGGVENDGQYLPMSPSRTGTRLAGDAQPFVTYVLRMLGLPRMRVTVELRD